MGWTGIPGMTTNLPPAAAFERSGDLFVFAVGSDQRVRFNRRTGTIWADTWSEIPGSPTTNCAVTASSDGSGNILVVLTGLDSKLYHTWYTINRWTAWELLDGGTGSSTMTCAVASDDREMVWVVTGTTQRLYTNGKGYQISA